MTLSVVSNATALTAASTLVFSLVLAASRFRRFVPRSRLLSSEFINRAPAGKLHRRWQRLGRQRSLALVPALFLILSLASLIVAEPALPMPVQSHWLQMAIVGLVSVCLGLLLLRGISLTIKRRRLLPEIDARLTVGHALSRVTQNRNRVFHDVPTSFGDIDHVVAGLHGVYAVCVVARVPARQAKVEYRGEELCFSDDSPAVSIEHARKLAARLAQESSKLLGHGLHVRLVIAVPGWEVHAQCGDDVLVTNERHLNMLTGWKDQRDYLLDDDVQALHAHFDKRCASSKQSLS